MDSSIIERETLVMRREGIDAGAIRFLDERKARSGLATLLGTIMRPNAPGSAVHVPHLAVWQESRPQELSQTAFPRGMIAA